MKISHITLVALSVNHLIDKKVKVSVSELMDLIEAKTLFEVLSAKNKDIRMEGIRLIIKQYPAEKYELLNALGRMSNAYESEVFGVDDKSNGLLYLNGMINEFLQETDIDIKLK
jgi:hypothetical protein